MTPSLKHIIGIIGTGLTTILAIWFGPTVPANPDLAAQIAQTLIVALALFLPAAKMSVVEKCFTAVAGTLATVLFFVAAKIPSGSAWATVIPVIVAVVTDLKTAWNDGDPTGSVTINPLGGGKTACFVALALGSLWLASPASAQEPDPIPPTSTCPQLAICVGKFTIQPTAALAYQIIPSTGEWKQGASLIGITIVTDQFGLPIGLGGFCGSGFGAGIPNGVSAWQCSGGVLVTNWGALLIGDQTYKDLQGGSHWQMVLSFAGTLTMGGTTATVRKLQADLVESNATVKSLQTELAGKEGSR